MRASLLIISVSILLSCVAANPTDGLHRRRLNSNERDRLYKRFIPMADEEGNIVTVDLLVGDISAYADIDDVTYYVYTRNTTDNPTVITNGDINQLITSPFDPTKRVLVITHGWNNDYTSNVNVLVRDAALQVEDLNVIVVDWGYLANWDYLTAFYNVEDIGTFEGAFLNQIQGIYGIDGSRFILVGHSLGAHVAGRAGSLLKSKAGQLIGCDPALPLFSYDDTDGRIDPTDANFVQVIHTCAGFLGYDSALGHADYYPNGGSSQPGCGLDLIGTCAHSRSYEYLAESILMQGGFTSTLCSDFDSFADGYCNGNPISPMGQLDVDKNASGDYYLATNDAEPFGLG